MLDDLLKKAIIKLSEPKRSEEVGRTVDHTYCRYYRMVSHHLEKCVMLKEHIIQLIEHGIITLNLDNKVKTNHISCQSKGLSLIQFGSLEPFVLHEHGLQNPVMQERSFPINIFDKLAVNMSSCSVVEEEIGKTNGRQENFLAEINKILDALEAIPVRLIGDTSLVCLTRRAGI